MLHKYHSRRDKLDNKLSKYLLKLIKGFFLKGAVVHVSETEILLGRESHYNQESRGRTKMKLTMIQELAVGWLLSCLVEFISGSPQRIYWTSPEVEMAVSYPEFGNRLPFRINHGSQYQGSSNSPYESIDQFQLEQRNQPQNGPDQSQLRYDYEDKYSNQFQNDQESYYQSLLRVTENPLSEIKYHETITDAQDSQSYYQDYLPLDDNENYNVEQRNSEINPPKVLNGVNEKVKNSTDQKIAVLISKLLIKGNSYLPNSNDLDLLNSVEDEMIAEASVPDEVKRGVRQVRRQQPGLLWTLARLAFEKVNDTKSAANQIGTIVSNNFSPDGPSTPSTTTTTTTTTTSSSLIGSDTTSSDTISNGTTTTTTTTEAPFRLTRTALQGIIRRNVKGLIRLFRIEWRDAVNQSYVSVRNFQRDLGNQIRPYLEDNPNVKL